MPIPDPVPPRPPSALGVRFLRILRLLAAFAIVIAGIAVLLVARGDDTAPAHMLIATALGVGLSVLLGGALMSLVFLSNRSGHDEAAGHSHDRKDPNDPRS